MDWTEWNSNASQHYLKSNLIAKGKMEAKLTKDAKKAEKIADLLRFCPVLSFAQFHATSNGGPHRTPLYLTRLFTNSDSELYFH